MSYDFNGKVIAVTGTGEGIGRATARLLAERGACVACMSILPGEVESLQSELKRSGYDSLGYVFDVNDRARVEDVFAEFYSGGKHRLHGLVNNAAEFYAGEPETVTPEIWDRVVDTNLKSAFFIAQYAVPLMEKSGGGSIVNVCSIEGIRGGNSSTCYAASKAGLEAVTRDLAVQYGPIGIRVNAVLPGNIATENDIKRIFSREGGEKELATFIKRVPLRRSGRPDEVAKLIAFLLSDESSYINGASIVIDGGYSPVL